MKEKRLTKQERCLMHLQEFGTITPWEAIKEYGNTRLAATVFHLKRKGYNIVADRVSFTDRYGYASHYAKYTLVTE